MITKIRHIIYYLLLILLSPILLLLIVVGLVSIVVSKCLSCLLNLVSKVYG